MHEDCIFSPLIVAKAFLRGVVKEELEELYKI